LSLFSKKGFIPPFVKGRSGGIYGECREDYGTINKGRKEVRKIRLDEMRSPEVAELLNKPNVVILPVGATEQHSRHLPINTDTFAAAYFADQVAQKVYDEHGIWVLVAPAIPYAEAEGTPPFQKTLPGTISISGETFIRLVEEVVRSIMGQGFRNLLVLNGHLENTHLIGTALRKVSIAEADAGLYAVNWFQLATEAWSRMRKGGKDSGGHSCEKETAFCLVTQPQNVVLQEMVTGTRSLSLSGKYALPMLIGKVFFHSRIGGVREGGLMGDPKAATKEVGEKLIDAVLQDLSEIVVAIARSERIKLEERP
jgi:creatinine amidohydrolase